LSPHFFFSFSGDRLSKRHRLRILPAVGSEKVIGGRKMANACQIQNLGEPSGCDWKQVK
jgi:hypothetical protein